MKLLEILFLQHPEESRSPWWLPAVTLGVAASHSFCSDPGSFWLGSCHDTSRQQSSHMKTPESSDLAKLESSFGTVSSLHEETTISTC